MSHALIGPLLCNTLKVGFRQFDWMATTSGFRRVGMVRGFKKGSRNVVLGAEQSTHCLGQIWTNSLGHGVLRTADAVLSRTRRRDCRFQAENSGR